MKADILSRKDQVNTQDDNKDIQMLKEELWTRRMTAEITILRRNRVMEKTKFLKKIQQNKEGKQTSLGRQQNSLCKQTNLHLQQQGTNTMRKS